MAYQNASTRTSTIAPTVNDDANDGYFPGFLWIDTVLDQGYICLDAAVGAAVWQLLGAAGVMTLDPLQMLVILSSATTFVQGTAWA
jgi:hypothetical protein